jgi:hypothetical protein
MFVKPVDTIVITSDTFDRVPGDRLNSLDYKRFHVCFIKL